MANQIHVCQLLKNVKQWNAWRQSQGFVPDLNGANLSGANLSGADLLLAEMVEADLTSTNLSGSILIKANLACANLTGTDLANVNMIDTILAQANLTNAILAQANLNNASLYKVNLNNAHIAWTIFGNVDISTAKGLETVVHQGPSTIGLDTIYRSRGQIPEIFLRGARVPKTFIANMRSLIESMSPIDYYTCFIAYSHHNKDFVKRLHADLQAHGVRCWFAEEDLKVGDHYHQRIDEAIWLYDKLIIILSDAAIQSTWVEREVVAAREKEDHQDREVLFPIRLDEAVMKTNQAWAADVRRRWHIGDFIHWKDRDQYQQAFERLLHDLKKADV